MFTLDVVDYVTFRYMSLIYGDYFVNVHFSDIPHAFIPHFTLHSAEKNPHRIFRKLPVDNFPNSAKYLFPRSSQLADWSITVRYSEATLTLTPNLELELALDASVNPNHPTDDVGEES